MDYKIFRGKFKICKNITWDQVIDKIYYEYATKTIRFIGNDDSKVRPPTFVCENYNYLPNTIQDAWDEVHAVYENINTMHVYTSFGLDAATAGRHRDTMDVMIVQAVGDMVYAFDTDCLDKKDEVILKPGDALYIPKGVHHEPLGIGPRISLSFDFK